MATSKRNSTARKNEAGRDTARKRAETKSKATRVTAAQASLSPPGTVAGAAETDVVNRASASEPSKAKKSEPRKSAARKSGGSKAKDPRGKDARPGKSKDKSPVAKPDGKVNNKAGKGKKAARGGKKDRAAAPKPRRRRDEKLSVRLPAEDFVLLQTLKQRAVDAGRRSRKSELVRAGLRALAVLDPLSLCDAVEALPSAKRDVLPGLGVLVTPPAGGKARAGKSGKAGKGRKVTKTKS